MDADELRAHLAAALEALRSGVIKPDQATATAAIAGQMIASAKVQVAYYALRGQRPAIPFLDARKTEPATIVHRISDDEPDARQGEPTSGRMPLAEAARQDEPKTGQ